MALNYYKIRWNPGLSLTLMRQLKSLGMRTSIEVRPNRPWDHWVRKSLDGKEAIITSIDTVDLTDELPPGVLLYGPVSESEILSHLQANAIEWDAGLPSVTTSNVLFRVAAGSRNLARNIISRDSVVVRVATNPITWIAIGAAALSAMVYLGLI